jgi:MFS family permease
LAAAVLSPAALSLLSTTFSEGRERNRAFGIYSALGASGFAIGVFLGGLLTDGPGWRWVFFVNVPIGLAGALLAPRVLPESRRETGIAHLDVPGGLAATLGLSLLVYGLTTAASVGWTAVSTWAWIAAGLVCLMAFAAIEVRSPAPLMPMQLLRRRPVVVSDLVMLLTSASVAPQVFVMTLYLQNVEGYSAAQTGFMFLVQGASAVLGAAIGSRGVSRFGLRPMLIGGRATAAVALALMALVLRNGSLTLATLLGALALIGLGNVATFVATSIGATSGVESSDVGLASGLLYTAQQIGAALGLSALVVLAATRTSSLEANGVDASTALVEGFRYALAGAALISTLAALVGMASPATARQPRQAATAGAGRDLLLDRSRG